MCSILGKWQYFYCFNIDSSVYFEETQDCTEREEYQDCTERARKRESIAYELIAQAFSVSKTRTLSVHTLSNRVAKGNSMGSWDTSYLLSE